MIMETQENWPEVTGVGVNLQEVEMKKEPPEPVFAFSLSDASSQEGSPASPPKNGLFSQEGSPKSSPLKVLVVSHEDDPASPPTAGVESLQSGISSSSPLKVFAVSQEAHPASPPTTGLESLEAGSASSSPTSGLPVPQEESIPSPPETVVVGFPVATTTIPNFPLDNQPDGSGESLTFPVSDHHATTVPMECFVVPKPKDLKVHHDGCNFYHWNVIHRESLLNIDSVKQRLLQMFCSIKGKTYVFDNMEEIERSIDGGGQGNIITKYMAGSMSTYESFRFKMMAKCKCPFAQAGNNQSSNSTCTAEANILPSFGMNQGGQVLNEHREENLLHSDLRISESESDEEMETN